MMPVKQVLKAAIVQDIQFRSGEYLVLYLDSMSEKGIECHILDRFDRYDGSVIVRVARSYCGFEMMPMSEVI